MPNYRKAARRAAKRHGLDPDVFERQIQQESGFNPNARSPAGAAGIAQFMPATAKGMGVNLHDGRAADDLDGAARLMASYVRKFGSYDKALRAYNAGEGAVDASRGYAETNAYVKRILNGRSPEPTLAREEPSAKASRYRTKTITTPGVDRSDERQQLKLAYLQQRGRPGALLALKASLDANQDTPDKTRTVRERVPGAASPSSTAGHGSGRFDVKELFWQGQHGIDIKNGQREPQGFVSGHTDHVHVASGPRQILRIAKIAQQMGLHVGENPAFGGVHPVHVQGSNHYKIKVVNGRKVGEAVDVSGDPAKMAEFAHKIARLRK